jgi:hypothetical protein
MLKKKKKNINSFKILDLDLKNELKRSIKRPLFATANINNSMSVKKIVIDR